MTDPNRFTLITGASEGLGKALALECASRNFNLVLVALPGKELWQLGHFIRRNFPVQVHCVEKDLSAEKQCISLVQYIQKEGLQVNMLINNAGLGGTRPFDETPLPFFEKQILLNVLGTTVLTRLLVEDLAKNSPSWILNVGSLAAFYFLPQKEVYGATKSYVYSLSRSLREELRNRDIKVSVVCPGGINTNLSVTLMNKSGNWLARQSILNPGEVAAEAIEGLLRGNALIIPGRLNRIVYQISRLLPEFICHRLSRIQIKRLVPEHPILRFLPPKLTFPGEAA